MPPVNISPLAIVWTHEQLQASDFQPYFAGDDWSLRASVRDANGNPLSLSGATVVATIKGGDVITRTTDEVITGDVLEIAHDEDQSAEDTSDPDNPTGKSWWTMRFHHSERETMAELVGWRPIQIVVTWGDGSEVVWGNGVFEVGARL